MSTMESKFIDTESSLKCLLDTLDDIPKTPPSLYVDIEGQNLSRHGTISILQIFFTRAKCAYLIDVYTLGAAAFSVQGSGGRSLKSILESETILKVFFDIRRDSDALFSLYDVHVAGVHDLQLMELATRSSERRLLSSLEKCIEWDSTMSPPQKRLWKGNKNTGSKLFKPELGGSYTVFDARPLPKDIETYCVQDVVLLPGLWWTYYTKMNQSLFDVVLVATRDRIRESQTKTFNCTGMHMALGHWKYQEQQRWRTFDQKRLSSTHPLHDSARTATVEEQKPRRTKIENSSNKLLFEATIQKRAPRSSNAWNGPNSSCNYNDVYDTDDHLDSLLEEFNASDSDVDIDGLIADGFLKRR